MKETQNELWGYLQTKSRFIETNMDSLERKRTGSYFTHIDLTDSMMHELVTRLLENDKPIEDYRFLEPCVGAGNFVFSYINEVNKYGLNNKKAQKLLNNIYVADINKEAIIGYKESLSEIARAYWGIELDDEYFDLHIGSGLLVDVTAKSLEYISISDVFDKTVVGEGFDIIATNPPYKNLKAERSQYKNEEEYNEDKEKYSVISQIVKDNFNYATDGVLNLYKLFVEEIIDKYAAKNAYVSLLIPASILSDKTCLKLRTHILKDMNLISVKNIGESSAYIDANQALSAILVKKGEKTETVIVTKDFDKEPCEKANIEIEDILNENTGNSIFAISESEYTELKILRRFPVVKDLDFIINLRGELDLTANKKFIIKSNSGYKLLRGRNIGYYSLIKFSDEEYVDESFVLSTKKNEYIKMDRIICQQIANMNKKRRVTFALTPMNYVLGNSCNFIAVRPNKYEIDIYALLGLFNTEIINWLFKLTSSNNHINNYEIDCFPIPVSSKYLKQISEQVKDYLETKDDTAIKKIEMLARKAYGLDASGEV